MIKIETLEAACRGVGETFFIMSNLQGQFHFGWRELLNKIKFDGTQLTILAEWPERWGLIPANATVDRGVRVQMNFFFGMKPESNNQTQYETLDKLQQYAQQYFNYLRQLPPTRVVNFNEMPLRMLPKGFTTDNSLWILVEAQLNLFDCVLPPFPLMEGGE